MITIVTNFLPSLGPTNSNIDPKNGNPRGPGILEANADFLVIFFK